MVFKRDKVIIGKKVRRENIAKKLIAAIKKHGKLCQSLQLAIESFDFQRFCDRKQHQIFSWTFYGRKERFERATMYYNRLELVCGCVHFFSGKNELCQEHSRLSSTHGHLGRVIFHDKEAIEEIDIGITNKEDGTTEITFDLEITGQYRMLTDRILLTQLDKDTEIHLQFCGCVKLYRKGIYHHIINSHGHAIESFLMPNITDILPKIFSSKEIPSGIKKRILAYCI